MDKILKIWDSLNKIWFKTVFNGILYSKYIVYNKKSRDLCRTV